MAINEVITLEIFVARQPIFDRNEKIFAYELLFRQGVQNSYNAMDGDQATSDVIANSFLTIGMETLTGGKRGFVNFTTNLLNKKIAHLLPSNLVVIEILENVEPDQDIIIACQKLKEAGFLLALDDFVFEERLWPLIDLADIIKIDFTITVGKERSDIIKRLISRKIKFLAEKVETREEFKFINSAAFGLKMKINSIKQALVLLGLSEVRKWASIFTLQTLGKDKPGELIVNSLVRAAFGEALALKTRLRNEASNIFLMGMFSLMDAFLDRPLAEVLEELPLTQEIKQTLVGENNRFSPIFDLILAYEIADWVNVSGCVQRAGLNESEISLLYFQALSKANQLAL